MTDKDIFVHMMWEGKTHFVGRLFTRYRKNRESASFEYDTAWLTNPIRFAIDPALTLDAGTFHTEQNISLFGSMSDTSPDRWGKMLMRRRERRIAELEMRSPRTLTDIDFCLRVDDTARMGALRFSNDLNGPYLATPTEQQRIPLFIELPKLLAATDRILHDTESADDIKLLFAPGASLGGARPKASLLDKNGDLLIAKFPHPEDEIDTPAWEHTTLSLAQKAGLCVTEHRLESVMGKSILLVKRFDRKKDERVPFLSLMSLLQAQDNEKHSYLEVVDALRQHSPDTMSDLAEMWKRMVFTILVSNTDDHLRNHGVLMHSLKGWSLSPAYDINPTPLDIKPRKLTTSIVENDDNASLDLALSVSTKFGLSLTQAKSFAKKIAEITVKWRDEAQKNKIKTSDINRMASAFEHQDLKKALAL